MIVQDTVNTRIGELTFQNGIPSKESIAKLYDEMDFQRQNARNPRRSPSKA